VAFDIEKKKSHANLKNCVLSLSYYIILSMVQRDLWENGQNDSSNFDIFLTFDIDYQLTASDWAVKKNYTSRMLVVVQKMSMNTLSDIWSWSSLLIMEPVWVLVLDFESDTFGNIWHSSVNKVWSSMTNKIDIFSCHGVPISVFSR